jgi:DNA-binding Lrp family transcriptional regulator
MKDVELRLISELLKNSRRSDRELAKVLHVSQPTVGRAKLRELGSGISGYFGVSGGEYEP